MISLCILCKQSLSCNSYLFRWSKEKRAGTQVTTFLDKDDEDAGEDRSNEDEVDNENEEEADDDLHQLQHSTKSEWQMSYEILKFLLFISRDKMIRANKYFHNYIGKL